MPQYGAQSTGKRQSLLFVHRDLGNAINLVFHGILDGNDFVLWGFDLGKGGIQGRCLSASRGPGHQDHAIRLDDVSVESIQNHFGKTQQVQPQLGKSLGDHLFVKDPDHGIFSVYAGHDGDAKIDRLILDLEPEPSILRHSPFGNIQVRYDFDPRDNGRLKFFADLIHGFTQNTIDPVLDDDTVLFGFDVDIAGPFLNSCKNYGVDELDDRAVLVGQFFYRNNLFFFSFLLHNLHHKALCGIFEDLKGGLALTKCLKDTSL